MFEKEITHILEFADQRDRDQVWSGCPVLASRRARTSCTEPSRLANLAQQPNRVWPSYSYATDDARFMQRAQRAQASRMSPSQLTTPYVLAA